MSVRHLSAVLTACVMSLHSAATMSRAVIAQEDYRPKIAEASGDAELALRGFVLPDGMSGSLLAAEPMVANPVCFTVTNDGRIIVCESFRQEVGVEDNRNHMNGLEKDLRLAAIELVAMREPQNAVPRLKELLDTGSVKAQQTALNLLGRIHTGILKREDESIVQLMTPTGALISVAKSEIDDRANGTSGMPQDLSKNITRTEIRDLVEYMTTLQIEPEPAHGK